MRSAVVRDPFSGPLSSLQGRVRHRQPSPQAQRNWRVLRGVILGMAALLVVGLWDSGPGPLLTAVVATAYAVVSIRWLTTACTLPRFWRWALGLTGACTWIPYASAVGQPLFVVATVFFLVFRRYRPYGELGSRRRALTFLAALGALAGLIATASDDANPVGAFGEMLDRVHGSARVFAALFWSFSAVHLFLGIRLHFLRLRPKLAVAGLLVAAVPVVLLCALAAVAIFGALGGSRATEAQSLLAEWVSLDGAAHARIFGPELGAGPGESGVRAALDDALAHIGYDGLPAGILVREGDHLWAARLDTTAAAPRLIDARRVTAATMQRLADRVGCEVTVVGEGSGDVDVTIGGLRIDTVPVGEGDDALHARPSSAATEDSTASWSRRWLTFGGATFEIFELEPDRTLTRRNALLSLQTRPIDLWNAYAGDGNEVNQAVLYALLSLAVMFLLLEALALYFGLRITGGITAAVGTLHKATQRLAQGDLGATIDLPNEDEFGDLAESFNDMTRAIRIAQDQLVQKQRLEQEIATARDIQQRLLPHAMPSLSGYEIAGSSTPSKMVGGDYFDFLPLEDGRLGIAVADVSGKGIPAALLMANLQASLQSQALHAQPVAQMVHRMNELLSRSTDAHMFATFFYGVLDGTTGRMVGVNAGHEPPLIVRADATIERLATGGLILGMLPGQSYRECQTTLGPGDVLVLYTDGITEAMGPGTRIPGMEALLPGAAVPATGGDDDDDDEDDDDEIVTNFFEEYRLRDVVVAHRHESADAIRRAVLAAVARHTQDVPQSDDITLVVVKRTAPVAIAAA